MTGCTTWDIANSHFFVLFVDVCIIFCLYKTGPQKKQHNTSPHFLFCFSYQNLGRRNYIFAQLLVIKSCKCSAIFDTVGEQSLPPSKLIAPRMVDRCRISFSTSWPLDRIKILQSDLFSNWCSFSFYDWNTSKKSLFWWWLLKNDQALYWS